MKTTSDYLDQVKEKLGFRSDRQLARAWGISHTLIRHYRIGVAPLPNERVMEIARTIDSGLDEIVMSMAIERAQRLMAPEIAETLRAVARRAGIRSIIATAATGAALALAPAPTQAAPTATIDTIDIMSTTSRQEKPRELARRAP